MPELDAQENTPSYPLWWKSDIPAKEEVISDDPILPLKNDVSKFPESKESHAAIHYSLLRHDATELLRRSVNEYKANPSMMDTMETKVYSKVRLQGLVADIQGISYRISFSVERSPTKIDWVSSKRLTAGSLVAISPISDNFNSKVTIAVVTKRSLEGGLLPDENEHAFLAPRIDVSWSDEESAKFMLEPDQEMVMIQAGNSGLYEAVRHVMEGLKRWTKEDTKFDKFFIGGNKKPRPAPLFSGGNSIINVESMVLPHKEFPNLNIDLSSTLPESFSLASGLDATQLSAFQLMLTKEISIVQGPPGTGKTFTSVSALKIILENLPRGDVILITAQTNRALDQLLMNCLNLGAKVARLGSRSREPDIIERTVRSLYLAMAEKPKSFGLHGLEKKRLSKVVALQEVIQTTYPTDFLTVENLVAAGLVTTNQSEKSFSLDWSEFPGLEIFGSSANPLVDWLEGRIIENSLHLDIPPDTEEDTSEDVDIPDPVEEEFAPQDQDDRKEVFIPLKYKYNVKTDKNVIESDALWKNIETTLRKHQDLYKIPVARRPWVYKLWLKKLAEAGRDQVWGLIKEISMVARACNRARQHRNADVVRLHKTAVLGCTTTGLTKYRELIEHVAPKVMLVEEAAETREANLVAAPLASIEQMILVGDHKQLAPHADVRCLSESPYNLCVSLFERLVNIGIPYVMLGVQRRMTPKIRSLISPFYESLVDHEIVCNRLERPLVPGMSGLETFWFHHEWPERLTGLKSRTNIMEARMLVGIFRYLVQNGTAPDKITVLTFYKGQIPTIRMLLREDTGIKAMTTGPFNVFTVDAFQGEENDVILLSLVRSPLDSGQWSVGFLDDFRRTVVALSRARRGLYIFGNFSNFLYAKKAQTAWFATQQILMGQKRQGPEFELVCEKHGTKTRVAQPDDLELLDGGCRAKCTEKLACGHACPKRCHSYHHDKVFCEVRCKKQLSCGHICVKKCSEECRCVDCRGNRLGSPSDALSETDLMDMGLEERLEMIIMSREHQDFEVNGQDAISDADVDSEDEDIPDMDPGQAKSTKVIKPWISGPLRLSPQNNKSHERNLMGEPFEAKSQKDKSTGENPVPPPEGQEEKVEAGCKVGILIEF
ncbi:hypothetical protein BROUX41_004395 [Berkeleyomyces rouxiae]|uniref:uncharacterized protein n=1 Tax=Berkeleyomyces rouxiae TaxID=2035830 RepID=UPI003B762D22